MELITTAKMMSAEEALQYRLVNYVFSLNKLIDESLKLAASISNNSPQAISSAIKAVNAGFKTNVDGYEKEIKNLEIVLEVRNL